MNIVVMGCGYVGLVTGACLAEMGNLVTCVDTDPRRVAQLRLGIVPFFEPGLESLAQRNTQQRRLSFTSDPRDAVAVAVCAAPTCGVACALGKLHLNTSSPMPTSLDKIGIRAARLQLRSGVHKTIFSARARMKA